MSFLQEHLGYVDDQVRVQAYQKAINLLVRPGQRVVDLGCGTGVLGLMCLAAGAEHVYALDRSPMSEIAWQTFHRSGRSEQATVIRGESTRVSLPERVDVVIADQVGYFGFDYGIVEQYADAARRFLKPGGILIPNRLRLKVAAVESDETYRQVAQWAGPSIPPGLRWLRELAANCKYAAKLGPQNLLAETVTLADIDLYANNPSFFSWTAEMSIQRDGNLHGIAGWFDCELTQDVWITNSPSSTAPVNRPQAFFPIERPTAVKPGDVVRVTVLARPADREITWVVDLPSGSQHKQSTWKSDLVSQADLARALPSHVPTLTSMAIARRIVLDFCDGHRSVDAVHRAVVASHPNLLPSTEEIRVFVAEVLRKDTL